MSDDVQTYDVTCLVCGGRGGWWSYPPGTEYLADGFREMCTRCGGTGWEPSEVIRAVVRAGGAA